ncbi:MAG: GH92 family glycosyl hydrolase, partial [Bacteroidota bacterium]|nr:GH92 family glycosyl hydrolase [Bacteroidota bacterium]
MVKLKYTLTLFVIFFTFLFSDTALQGQSKKLTSYVNPFIGTDGFGHTFPGASLPFGMVQLSPDTRTSGWENCSGYHASNPTIIGFSHTHLSGTGAADYGDILFMATSGVQLMAGEETNPLSGYRSAFKQDSEKATPGYYRVMLADHGIQAEMSATTRCGFHKYTFPASAEAVIVTDLVHGISDQVIESEIEITGNKIISGYRRSRGWAKDHTIYFYAEFSKGFTEAGLADSAGKKIDGLTQHASSGLKSWLKFNVRNYEAIMVKVGISTVSVENAKLNLATEIPEWDFTQTMLQAKEEWESELQRIIVEGGDKTDKVNFYTSLYHTMLAPNIMSDVDGRYRGMDGKIHKMERGNMYTVYSLWDTFRALHPLFTVIDPNRAQDFVRALLIKFQESGLLPVWELASNETNCMIGYHAVPVIVDSYRKGLRDFDLHLAWEAITKSSVQNHLGLTNYKIQGYVPADRENESVSKTLEYAYDDWCISLMAEEMKKKSDASYYNLRSQNYKNVYDVETGFMRGKKNGNWVTPFEPSEVSGIYTEANAWQYTWFAPHDIQGLIELMGGKKAFADRLDVLFNTSPDLKGRSQPDISGMIGQYAHGNEPSHHMAYLYNWTDSSHKTAELVHTIMKKFYTNNRDGLIGNEDCGQMSAWYVFSAMGFYPVCPGDNSYAFGSPLFNKVIIGKGTPAVFTIEADSVSEKYIYINKVLYNGDPLQGMLQHHQLAGGG